MTIPGIPSDEWGRINKLFNKGRIDPASQDSAVARLQAAIKNSNVLSPQTYEEIEKILKKELKKKPTKAMIENAVFALTLTMIFKTDDKGEEVLDSDLKKQLQMYDVLSPQARSAIAQTLGKGSALQVDPKHKIVQQDLDEIALKTTEKPEILFN